MPFADNESGAVFDFVAVSFEAIDERVVGVVEPFDELAFDFVPESHVLVEVLFPVRCSASCAGFDCNPKG